MRTLYLANVTLHVLAATTWLGGMFFLGLVGAPVLRRLEPALRARLFAQLGESFRTVGWGAIAVLVATGFGNLWFAGVLRGGRWADHALWSSRYGHTLACKLGAVAVMIAISAVHDFALGPLSARTPPGTPQALRLRARAAWLARINVLVALVLVIAAVRLARGG